MASSAPSGKDIFNRAEANPESARQCGPPASRAGHIDVDVFGHWDSIGPGEPARLEDRKATGRPNMPLTWSVSSSVLWGHWSQVTSRSSPVSTSKMKPRMSSRCGRKGEE